MESLPLRLSPIDPHRRRFVRICRGSDETLLGEPAARPAKNTSYRRRRWWKRRLWRNRLIVRRKAAIVWFCTLILFAAIDVFLLVYAVLGLIGIDLDWLGS